MWLTWGKRHVLSELGILLELPFMDAIHAIAVSRGGNGMPEAWCDEWYNLGTQKKIMSIPYLLLME